MSYPSGPPGGFPNQPPGSPVFGNPQAPNPLSQLGVPKLLALLVLVLALVVYFCSFGYGWDTDTFALLGGGLLAGLHVLPRAPRTLPFAVVLSLIGGLGTLSIVISRPGDLSLPTAFILILVFGLAQAAVSVIALLFDWDIIKMPVRPAMPHGYQPGPGFPPPFQPGQPPHQGPPSAPFSQQPPPQQTHFMQQPGQFSQPGGFLPPNGE